MRTRLASFLLLASGISLSFVCIAVAWLVPWLFHYLYPLKSFHQVREIMPAITRIATDYSWLFVLLIAVVSLAGIVCLRHSPDRVVEYIIMGLCTQGLITWTGMFCFFFEGFIGLSSLQHGPEFDSEQFVLFGFGVFPVTLLLMVALLIMALRRKRTPEHERVA